MAWMNRQDNSGGEQGDYLNAADSAGRPMAIASLLITLVLIGAITLLLFSVGRWAYNRLNQTDASIATTSETSSPNGEPQGGNDQQPAPVASGESSPTQDSSVNGSSQSSLQTGTPQQGSDQGNTANTTPATGATPLPETVPNTGASTAAVYFVISSLLATTGAYTWQLLRQRTY